MARSRSKNLKIGDLVTHVLYGKEWVGVIISFEKEYTQEDARARKALVQIQPGTKYDGFFDKRSLKSNRIRGNLGYVSVNWLFKLGLKKPERKE